MALLLGTGTPTSAQGADGDYFLSTDQRFFYGPRANGTWPPSPMSLQGPSGPALIASNGAPGAATGSVGQGAVDISANGKGTTYLKTANGWQLVASGAFQGPPGPATATPLNLANVAYSAGPQAGFTTATTTTANQVLPIPGTTTSQVFVAPANCSFAGLAYLVPGNSGTNLIFNLYDQTAGQVVYTTGTVVIGTVGLSNKLSTPIGLVAGNQHVWRCTAGSNALCTITPYYMMPATSTVGVSTWPTACLSTDTSYSGTATVLRAPGATAAANGPAQYIQLPKAGYMQYATITVTGSASVQLVLQTGSTAVFTSATVSAANSPYTTPIQSSSSVPLVASTNYLWYATGSGTGQVYVNTGIVS